MKVLYKIILFITLFIFAYLIYRLYMKSSELEPFAIIPTPDSEYQSMVSSTAVHLQDSQLTVSIGDGKGMTKWNMPFSQCVIKGSYNSACTGRFMNTDALSYVLSRGCRYLDLEIFYINSVPCVGVSSSVAIMTPGTQNTITLDDALSTIVTSAFNSRISPNVADPLFVNLRIKSTDPAVFGAVSKSVSFNFNNKLNKKPVIDDTLMNTLAGTITVSIDYVFQPFWRKQSVCQPANQSTKKCYNLQDQVMIEAGSEKLPIYTFGNIQNEYPTNVYVLSNGIDTNVQNMHLVQPDDPYQNNPKNISPVILQYGGQIIPLCFYCNDQGLANYEQFFDDNNAAIVPLSTAIIYFNKMIQ